MKVGMRIGSVSAGALFILLIVGFSAYYSVSKLVETNTWVSHTQDVLEQLSMLVYSSTEVQTSSRGYLITGQKQYPVINSEAILRVRATEKRLQELASSSPKPKAELSRIDESIEGLIKFYLEAMDTYDKQGYEPAANMIRSSRGQNFMNEIKKLVAEMTRKEKQELSERLLDCKESADHTLMTIISGTLLAIAFVSLFGYLVTGSITTPMSRLLRASENMERGRLDAITNIDTNDEFEELATAFNQLGQSLQDAMDRAESEKLTRAQAQETATTLRANLGTLQSRIHELDSLSKQHIWELDDQQRQIGDIIARETELANAAAMLKKLSAAACEQTADAMLASDNIATTHTELTRLLDTVEQQLRKSIDNIGSAGERTAELGDLIATIDGLAAELNMVALNATIEHGRGTEQPTLLPLLAEQLRSLSERTRLDGIRVRQLISRIEKSLSKASAGSEEAASSSLAWRRSDVSLATQYEQLRQALQSSQRSLGTLAKRAGDHEDLHKELPNRLSHVQELLIQQGIQLKIAELKSDEIRQLSTSGQQQNNPSDQTDSKLVAST